MAHTPWLSSSTSDVAVTDLQTQVTQLTWSHYCIWLLHYNKSIYLSVCLSQQWPQDWKSSVLIPVSNKGFAKDCSNNHTIGLISQASKVMLKILQAMLWQYVNQEISDLQAELQEAEEPVIKLPTSVRSWRKQGSSRKTSISASLTILKPLTVWVTTTCGKFLKWWEYQTTLLVPWETGM